MKEKIITTIICILMLVPFLPNTQAGINTFKIAEIVTDGSLDYTWTEYNDSDWYVNEFDAEFWTYRCSITETELRTSIPSGGTTHRGVSTIRVNASITNTYEYGIIFNYIDYNTYYYAGVYTLGGNPRYGILGTDNGDTTIFANTSDIDLSEINVSCNWTVLKVIYNPYVGHVLLKGWEITDEEPASWNLSHTNVSFITTSPVQWGLVAWAGTPDDSFDFWGIVIADLHYDTRSVGGEDVPVIEAPQINFNQTLESFEDDDYIKTIDVWNDIGQVSWLTYQGYPTYPAGNIVVFTVWNYSLNAMLFLIFNDNDNQNSSLDWISLVFDINHNHLLDAGDKWYFYDKRQNTTLDSYILDADSNWVATDETCYAMWRFNQSGITRYSHTQWLIYIEPDQITPPSQTLSEFADSGEYIGLSIYGDQTAFVWNNWDMQTNTSLTDLYNATGGAYNNTEEQFDTPDPDGVAPLTYFGDFRLIGYEAPLEEKFVDLSNSDSLEDYGISYLSAVWHVTRYALNTESMLDDNITTIKVPTTVSKYFFFGLMLSSIPVSSVNFYGINITDYKLNLLTADVGKKGNYTLDLDDIESYDIIVVVPNPSSLDTNNIFFKWLYKNDITTVLS